jgi:L-lactate dehydrogenase complex protein LldF
MAAAGWTMRAPGRFSAAERASKAGRVFARGGRIRSLPPPMSRMAAPWTAARDLPAPPRQTFRQWWAARSGAATEQERHGRS